jgi:hypothetical protein
MHRGCIVPRVQLDRALLCAPAGPERRPLSGRRPAGEVTLLKVGVVALSKARYEPKVTPKVFGEHDEPKREVQYR